MYKALYWLFFIILPSQATPLKLVAESSLVPIVAPFFDDWFQEAGVVYQLERCSAARCSKLLEADSSIHGDAARRLGFEEKIPRLAPVGLSYSEVKVYALSLNATTWPPSSKETLACIRGTFWCERTLDKKSVVWTNTKEQAEKMLIRGRVAWAIMTKSSFHPHPGGKWHYIDTVEGFLFVDKKMQDEIKRLVEAQSRLIESGRWQKMQRKHFYEALN
ncbi:TPA: hypothetical protein SIA35_004017 [Aeromonas sobria]|nr:hypothetical protein [Aeromonas sobria]